MGEAVSGGLSIYFAPLPTPLIRSSASRLTGCGRGIFFPFLLFSRRYCAARYADRVGGYHYPRNAVTLAVRMFSDARRCSSECCLLPSLPSLVIARIRLAWAAFATVREGCYDGALPNCLPPILEFVLHAVAHIMSYTQYSSS